MPQATEKRLLGSRRLHRWFVDNKKSSTSEARGLKEVNSDDVPYVEVQPLVALMSKRRLTEYYFTTMGSSSYSLEDSASADGSDSGAAFLEKHLEGVPDVLAVPNEEAYSNSQEHLYERTV